MHSLALHREVGVRVRFVPFPSDQVQNTTIEVVGDTLVVTDNGNGGSFTKQMATRVTASGQVGHQLIHDAGTYTRNGTAATFEFSSTLGGCLYCNSDGAAVGTIGGGKITLSDEGGVSWVYQK